MKVERIDQYDVSVGKSQLKQNMLVLARLQEALGLLIETYVANRNTSDSQFIKCITPKGTPYYWDNAIQAHEFAEKFVSEMEEVLEE